MSSFTDCQAIFDLLSNGQGDDNLFAQLYADVVNTLGPAKWHTNRATIPVFQGNPTITLPSSLLELITIIFDGQALSQLEHRELEVLNFGWRNATGTPIAYTLDDLPAQQAELYPAPSITGTLGLAIYVESRANVLPILTLPVALLVLQREFVRESDHTDVEFGNLCGMLGSLLLQMLQSEENSL